MNNDIQISINNTVGSKYLPIISMISISFLITAMIFTYHIIEFGPFLTPGGVIPFAITYIIAAIVTETYGYRQAKIIIFGNFICIFVFNITVHLLLKFHSPLDASHNEAFSLVFNQALFVMCVYSAGFLFGDLVNAFFVSKWRVLLKGRYFFIRLIGASIIGQISFSTIVIPSLYIGTVEPEMLIRQFITTIAAKILVIIGLSYPSAISVQILRRLEKLTDNLPTVLFNPFSESKG